MLPAHAGTGAVPCCRMPGERAPARLSGRRAHAGRALPDDHHVHDRGQHGHGLGCAARARAEHMRAINSVQSGFLRTAAALCWASPHAHPTSGDPVIMTTLPVRCSGGAARRLPGCGASDTGAPCSEHADAGHVLHRGRLRAAARGPPAPPGAQAHLGDPAASVAVKGALPPCRAAAIRPHRTVCVKAACGLEWNTGACSNLHVPLRILCE